jgi:hypothetical protein
MADTSREKDQKNPYSEMSEAKMNVDGFLEQRSYINRYR